jgi:chromosome segregation ATPase
MASSTQSGLLPTVALDVRQHGAHAATFALDAIDFLIGSVPGCDLRIAGANAPAVLCLFARHPGGLSLRKLSATHAVLVNGTSVSQYDLVDNDRVQVGLLEIVVRISTPAGATGNIDHANREFQQSVAQFRDTVVRFQKEKEAFERERQTSPALWHTQRGELQCELDERRQQLEERGFEIDRLRNELTKTRQEMADLRRQRYEPYQERRILLASMQDDVEAGKHDIEDRLKKLQLEEQDAAARRLRDRTRQEELDQRAGELTQRESRLEEERREFEKRQQDQVAEYERKHADLIARESALAEQVREWEGKLKQYRADVLRLNRLEGDLEAREADLNEQIENQTRLRDKLQIDSAELEAQLIQADELRATLTEEAERLARQKQQQDTHARQLAERTAALEGQQSSLAVLRGRLERMRDDIRVREQQIDQTRASIEAREADLARQQQTLETQQQHIESEQRAWAADRQQWLQRSAVMDAAVRQLKQAQEQFAAEEQRLRAESVALDERKLKFEEADGILQGRLAQVAETRERFDLDRKALQERSINLVQREEACVALQEQLHHRSDELAARHKEITDRLNEYQIRFTELETRREQLDLREEQFKQQADTLRREVEAKELLLKQQQAEMAGFDEKQQHHLNQLAIQRKSQAEERVQFQMEQEASLHKLAQARNELETLRGEALALVEQLPDAELRAGAAVDRLGHARELLRGHLGEIHTFVRQCSDELEQLRSKLQTDLEKLQHQETTLRRDQDEHRLAVVAFRQQMLDWQGQIADLKRTLSRDETRLERRQSQTEERVRAVEAESARLAQHAKVLHQQERDVADLRSEIDHQLGDMREWYRRKLRELAGIPLTPATPSADSEPTILPGPTPAEASEDGEPGIVPTHRSILSITSAVDAGDHKLGQVLRESQLIDADTLTALLAESRRQRRSLRQVLLASGVITLYQLALIEAGNIAGLALGPVRIVDRLRNTAHETVYRVYDPRRGAEAVLRHLSEADMSDAIRPDEFRQRFTQSKLNDPHLANTLEVLEISERPAVLQEWLTGLPASDWPPLAAAPGVCYRLLTQAAQGLATAHKAGIIHGHLSDALLLLTGDGVLKICGLGEPPWLIGTAYEEELTQRDDLRTLGKIVSGWCTPTGVRKGPKTKPLPEALVSVLYRLAADGEPGYHDVQELLDDLQKAAASIPPNAEAWDRLLKYVRDNGAAEAMLRQSA